MAAQHGDTHRLEGLNGSESIPAVPYASRGAGLYSEVSWDPITALRTGTARAEDKDGGSSPVASA